jgi:hypothetical protein
MANFPPGFLWGATTAAHPADGLCDWDPDEETFALREEG